MSETRRGSLLRLAGTCTGVIVLVLVLALTTQNAAKADDASSESVDVDPEERDADDSGFSPFVDFNGNIRLPAGYSSDWSHLGTFAVADKPGEDVSSLHVVYTQPDVIQSYQETGEFPDGAILIKEIRNVTTGRLTTGHVAWSSDMDVWFVMVKDSEGRFEGNDDWGDGWGWALFDAGDPTTNISDGYEASCIGCHIPARKDDWVYVRGYPALRDVDTEEGSSE